MLNSRPIITTPSNSNNDSRGNPNNNNNNNLYSINNINRFTNYKSTFFKVTDPNKDRTKLKRNDIGIFNPFADDPKDIGIIKLESDLIYINVTLFKDYLIALFKDNSNGSIYK